MFNSYSMDAASVDNILSNPVIIFIMFIIFMMIALGIGEALSIIFKSKK